MQDTSGIFYQLWRSNRVSFFIYRIFSSEREKILWKLPGAKFDKIVLCPLLIDFGYKNLNNKDCFYNLPPAKPIVNQVVDLINALWFYYNYDLILHLIRKEG